MKSFIVRGSSAILGVALCLALGSCSANQNPSPGQDLSSDPAQVNLAPAGAAVPAQQTAALAPQPPPQQTPVQQAYAPQPQPAPSDQNYDQNYDVGTDDTAYGEQPVYAEQPPPPIPEYTQPPCPGENYIWTPGYWGYTSEGYYWVPGAWVLAPYVGALWTPPYWAYANQHYRWYRGYWAPHIGFYGGINYGFGYVGHGYEGGYWNRDVFHYNRVVNNVNINVVHNVYNYRITNFTQSKVSYNGGRDGLNVRPTARELEVLHEQRIAPVSAQVQHRQQAATDRAQFDSVNHGHPQTFAAARPLATEYRAPAAHPSAVPGARVLPHPNLRQGPAPTAQRPEERPSPMARTPEARTEQRPAQQPPAQQRPAEQRQFEQRPAPQARQEANHQGQTAPQPRTEQRPAAPETHPLAQPRPEQRPAPQPRSEGRPGQQPQAGQRPAPQSRTEERTMPQRPAQAARPEARPAPQPRSEQRAAPQAHQEGHPAPQGHQESRPNQKKEDQHPH